jgi:hypothetical protein
VRLLIQVNEALEGTTKSTLYTTAKSKCHARQTQRHSRCWVPALMSCQDCFASCLSYWLLVSMLISCSPPKSHHLHHLWTPELGGWSSKKTWPQDGGITKRTSFGLCLDRLLEMGSLHKKRPSRGNSRRPPASKGRGQGSFPGGRNGRGPVLTPSIRKTINFLVFRGLTILCHLPID